MIATGSSRFQQRSRRRITPLVLMAAATLLAFGVEVALAQERYVGVRRDGAGEIILFSLELLDGAERKIATLQKEGAAIQLLGITMLNSRRGTFSYAYTDTPSGKDYLHTVSTVDGRTVARIVLPADVTGLEVVTDPVPVRQLRSDQDAIQRRIESLEQDIRRLQGQVRSR